MSSDPSLVNHTSNIYTYVRHRCVAQVLPRLMRYLEGYHGVPCSPVERCMQHDAVTTFMCPEQCSSGLESSLRHACHPAVRNRERWQLLALSPQVPPQKDVHLSANQLIQSVQSPPRVPLQGTFPQLPHPSSLCMAKYTHIREVVHWKGNFTWTISQVENTTAIWMKPSTKWSTGAGHLYCGVPNLRNQVFPPENFGHK